MNVIGCFTRVRSIYMCVCVCVCVCVCDDKDGVVDWCIVLMEMPLTRFEECWPLPTESLSDTAE